MFLFSPGKDSILRPHVGFFTGEDRSRYCAKWGSSGKSIVFPEKCPAASSSALYTREESLENTIVASSAFECTFSCGLYVLLEYFYNSAALNREPTLLSAYGFSLISGYDEATHALLANRFLTFNRHYAALALGYDITPLLRAELFPIYDHEGKFILPNSTLKYKLHQDIDISCAVMAARKTGETSKTSELAFVEKHPLVYAVFTWFFF